MSSRYFHTIVIVLYWACRAQAQQPQCVATLSRDRIKIGEQVTLTLQVQGKSLGQIAFPLVGDTLTAAVEVVHTSKIDSLKGKGEDTLRQVFTITAFDSGRYVIPSFVFVGSQGKKKDTLKTVPLYLYVNNVSVDTSKAFKDIKNVASLPEPPADYAWMWWLLLLIPIGLGLYYFFKMRKKTPVPIIAEVRIPAHAEALAALADLEQAQLWQKNEYKHYHSRLTEIVRMYIERRFEVPAMEHTSDQVLNMMQRSQLITAEAQEKLAQLLHLADVVKFAKYVPIGPENDLSMHNAISFVGRTAAQEQKPLKG